MSTLTVNLDTLARRSGVPKEDIKKLFKSMETVLTEGSTIRIPDFGTFSTSIQEPRAIRSGVIPIGTMTKRRRKLRLNPCDALRTRFLMEG